MFAIVYYRRMVSGFLKGLRITTLIEGSAIELAKHVADIENAMRENKILKGYDCDYVIEGWHEWTP